MLYLRMATTCEPQPAQATRQWSSAPFCLNRGPACAESLDPVVLCDCIILLLHGHATDAVPAGVSASKGDKGAEGQGAEAGSAAGPVNKAAAEKADKLIRLSEREQAEGRTGGQAGQRIVYDDAAIERLLDRCTIHSQ